MSKPHLYSLMIGIDNYPIARHRLNGCINDQKALKSYFEKKIPKSRRHIKTLFDKKATRQNIINNFSHFDKAKAGDICVFSYSGHGSQVAAPKEFHHLESDAKNESIVCYDSRRDNGRDLMDKELGWLLWKASQKKDVHFLVIMDCCHSGSNTRNTEYTARMANARSIPTPARNYLGFEDYVKTKVGRTHSYIVPKGNHVHLAGAKSNELAKELIVDGETRGIFTFSLLETLEQSGGSLSYAQLINQVRIKVFNRVDKQSPQVEGIDQHQLFLGGKIPPLQLQVGYNGLTEKWQLNAGQLHGIIKGNRNEPTTIQLEDETKVSITKVLPAISELKDFEPDDYMRTFNARILEMARPKLKLAFTPTSEKKQKDALIAHLDKESISIVTKNKARYFIQANADGFQLLKRGEKIPIFKSIKGTARRHVIDFWNKVKKVAKWVYYSELSNPTSQIKDTDIRLEIFRTKEAGNLEDDAPVKKIRSLTKPIKFKYLSDGEKFHSPAFQAKLTNNSKRTLWLSVLYFSKDSSITNSLLPKHELEPKKSIWLRQLFEGIEYRTIPLELNNIYFKQDIHEIFETLKIMISSEEFDTEGMCQEGLPQEVKRNIGGRRQRFTTDWATKEVQFQIIRK